MKRLPLICFAVALLLLGLGLWNHDQVKARNAAARTLHAQQLAWRLQQIQAQQDAAIDAAQRAVDELAKSTKAVTDLKTEAAHLTIQQERSELWRDFFNSVRARSVTDTQELEAIRAQADKDRGF